MALRPDQRRRLWERGISCYYAGRYREGADQFTAYQDFDDSDVENAVWHVLCLSRIDGLAAAQRQMMKVKRDERVPMMSIYDLFRRPKSHATGRPADTSSIAELSADQRRTAYFYAHLYIGLFFEASGDERQAREHISIAAEKYRNPPLHGGRRPRARRPLEVARRHDSLTVPRAAARRRSAGGRRKSGVTDSESSESGTGVL